MPPRCTRFHRKHKMAPARLLSEPPEGKGEVTVEVLYAQHASMADVVTCTRCHKVWPLVKGALRVR